MNNDSEGPITFSPKGIRSRLVCLLEIFIWIYVVGVLLDVFLLIYTLLETIEIVKPIVQVNAFNITMFAIIWVLSWTVFFSWLGPTVREALIPKKQMIRLSDHSIIEIRAVNPFITSHILRAWRLTNNLQKALPFNHFLFITFIAIITYILLIVLGFPFYFMSLFFVATFLFISLLLTTYGLSLQLNFMKLAVPFTPRDRLISCVNSLQTISYFPNMLRSYDTGILDWETELDKKFVQSTAETLIREFASSFRDFTQQFVPGITGDFNQHFAAIIIALFSEKEQHDSRLLLREMGEILENSERSYSFEHILNVVKSIPEKLPESWSIVRAANLRINSHKEKNLLRYLLLILSLIGLLSDLLSKLTIYA